MKRNSPNGIPYPTSAGSASPPRNPHATPHTAYVWRRYAAWIQALCILSYTDRPWFKPPPLQPTAEDAIGIMIVPFSNRPPEPEQEMPDGKYLLLALGQMHRDGRLADLTQSDQPYEYGQYGDFETNKGIRVRAEQERRDKRLSSPPGVTDRVMRPGEDRVDPTFGVRTNIRRVKGI